MVYVHLKLQMWRYQLRLEEGSLSSVFLWINTKGKLNSINILMHKLVFYLFVLFFCFLNMLIYICLLKSLLLLKFLCPPVCMVNNIVYVVAS